MNQSPPSRIDERWHVPPPAGAPVRRAIDYHISQLAYWLRIAGAEPRFCLILCDGKGARQRLMNALAIHEVRVQVCTSTLKRPLPLEVLAYHGDHFNDTLFLIDGFEDETATELFKVLQAQRSGLRRNAAWVAIYLESLYALERLYAAAPLLCNLFQRRVPVLAAGASDTLESIGPERLQRWRKRRRIAELIFHTALSPSSKPSYEDFSHLVAAGYTADNLGRTSHRDFEAMVNLWAAGADRVAEAERALAKRKPGPAFASAIVRHALPESAPVRALLAEHLEHDPLGAAALAAARLAAGEAEELALAPLSAPWQRRVAQVRALLRKEEVPSARDLRDLRSAAESLTGNFAGNVLLCAAEVAAAREDLPALAQILDEAERILDDLSAPLAFDIQEKRAAVCAFMNRRSDARAALDDLQEIAVSLHSPGHDARYRAAHGAFLAMLDPARAVGEIRHAYLLFSGHGFPEEAAQMAAQLEALGAPVEPPA